MVSSYQELIVWQKAIDVVALVYKYTDTFPSREQFGITSQMRKSAVSIPSNIAEGRYRSTRKDFRKFLRIAFASGAELETQLILSQKLGFGAKDMISPINKELSQVMRMLNAMITSLSSQKKKL